MRGKELVKLLEQNGWAIKRIKGSHHYMGKGDKSVSVPVHNRELGTGIVSAILKQAGIDV
jgi:predicted RNA binding protein YcfA (HicA-like mRNA interferase family)